MPFGVNLMRSPVLYRAAQEQDVTNNTILIQVLQCSRHLPNVETHFYCPQVFPL